MRIIGRDHRSMPVCGPFNRINFSVVLVLGDNNDLAAYRGSGPDEWIAQHGDKLNLREAIAHFPLLEQDMANGGLKYRDD